MTNDSQWLRDVQGIEQLRDELRVKAALLRADLRDEMAALEKQWARIEHELAPLRAAAGTTAREIGTSTVALLKTVRTGYERIRDAAKGHG